MQGAALGVVDGVITALGVALGVSALTSNKTTILVVGLCIAIADALSNSAGFFAVGEVWSTRAETKKKNYTPVLFCFIATFIAVMLPIIPFRFAQLNSARLISVAIGLSLLFMFGMYIASVNKKNHWKKG